MKKFNLMQILPTLNSGGVEQGTLDVANYLAKNQNHNFIISNGGEMLSSLNKKFTHHYELPVNSKNFLKMPFTALKINKIIKEKNIDILHIRSRAPAWLLPYLNKTKIKTISTFHNIYNHQNFIKRIYNSQLANVDKIIAISEYVKNEIIKIYKINPNKILIINRGTDTDFFKTNINAKEEMINFLNKNKIDKEKKVVLYPGRLTEWKGQIEFLKVIEYFKSDPIIFYFVGDNKNLSFYNKLVKKINQKNISHNCRLLGNLNKQDLKTMYQCSDVVISAPLRPEGFGRIVSECLAMKKIILAYNYGGVKNQIENLDPIYKIKPFDFDEMKTKINLVLNLEESEISRMGNFAREYIVNFFSKDSMLSSYNKIYQEILD